MYKCLFMSMLLTSWVLFSASISAGSKEQCQKNEKSRAECDSSSEASDNNQTPKISAEKTKKSPVLKKQANHLNNNLKKKGKVNSYSKSTTTFTSSECGGEWTLNGSGSKEDAFMMSVSSTTTTSTELSSTTSGLCESSASNVDVQQYRFVASSMNNLAKNIAQGGGEYVTTLANLEGCPIETHEKFSQLVQKNFIQIFSESGVDPNKVLLNIENKILADPLLSSKCSTIS